MSRQTTTLRSILTTAACVVAFGCEAPTAPARTGGGFGYYQPQPPTDLPKVFGFSGVIRGLDPAREVARTVLFSEDWPEGDHLWADGGATEYWFYFIGSPPRPNLCDGQVLSFRVSDGFQLAPRPINQNRLDCPLGGGVQGPVFGFPEERAPISVDGAVGGWGENYTGEKRGVLEFFSPDGTAVHWTFFADRAVAGFDFRSSIGIEPGQPIPDDFCQYLVRARALDGRVSEIVPLFGEAPDECVGFLWAETITLPDS